MPSKENDNFSDINFEELPSFVKMNSKIINTRGNRIKSDKAMKSLVLLGIAISSL
jgi:hypothetical protein